MSDNIVIDVKNVHKHFDININNPRNFKKALTDLFKKKVDQTQFHRRIVVFDGVSFQIRRGEFVGIMGRNGVGKSTILKMISGIYKPSIGEITTKGRIAPLLELGAGFSDDLSGYENIFLNAAILGFSKKEAEHNIQQIMAFSELGDHIYLPVRTYSSGMLVRLGFAIAVHLDSEILLFDEALSVGDAGFQAKCIRKIRELHKERNRTIILVTHAPGTVQEFADRCILFDHGKLVFDGSADEGAKAYNSLFGL
ncbi:MAG: ABC transporter ATP-binding protein [Bdellovibrionaceae bacterium]|nr:ABC transporter ATP-binding protein [Pseudobdellovibrionaceae bacterium]